MKYFSVWKKEYLKETELKNIKYFNEYKNSKKLLKMFYELEYKYNILINNNFNGLNRRKENIRKILEKKSNEIIIYISNGLIEIFEYYLKVHGYYGINELLKAKKINKYDKDMLRMEIRCLSLKLNIKIKNADTKNDELELQQILIKLYKIWLKKIKNNKKLNDVIQNIIKYKNILSNINNYSIKEKFMYINESLHITHRGGSILDYSSHTIFRIYEYYLNELSNQDVSEWNEELREIGVDI